LATYSASKFFVRGFTEAMNIEWERHGIHVCDVMPNFVATPMMDAAHGDIVDLIGINLTAEDAAKTIARAAEDRTGGSTPPSSCAVMNNTPPRKPSSPNKIRALRRLLTTRPPERKIDMSRHSLNGKSVIVTGASGGIGSATVAALVAKGARVTLVDLSQDAVDKVATALPASQVLSLAADVTSVDQMTTVTTACVERFGKIDVVLPNAGIANDPPTTLAAANLDAYERVIDVDLLGVVRTIKPALAQIIENRGYVLITASIYAFFNGVINSAYAASKAGVEMLGRSLRLELAPDGASAGVLYPGSVATPLVDATRRHNPARHRDQRTPLSRPAGQLHRALADRRGSDQGHRESSRADHRAQALGARLSHAWNPRHGRRQAARARQRGAAVDQAHRRRGARPADSARPLKLSSDAPAGNSRIPVRPLRSGHAPSRRGRDTFSRITRQGFEPMAWGVAKCAATFFRKAFSTRHQLAARAAVARMAGRAAGGGCARRKERYQWAHRGAATPDGLQHLLSRGEMGRRRCAR